MMSRVKVSLFSVKKVCFLYKYWFPQIMRKLLALFFTFYINGFLSGECFLAIEPKVLRLLPVNLLSFATIGPVFAALR